MIFYIYKLLMFESSSQNTVLVAANARCGTACFIGVESGKKTPVPFR